jgi:catechol 2,3-dioxygenase-like lactoylglutathione lyase family enzyme
MNLNHIDLQVFDVHAARSFFETHFDLRCTYARGDEIAILDDEAGMSLAVSNLGKRPSPTYPPDFHVGFRLEDAAQVGAVYERLQHAGLSMKLTLTERFGNVFFVCLGPDGIPIEVSAAKP